MGIKGVVKNGVVVVEGDRRLPEGAEVDIVLAAELIGKELEPFVGSLEGPRDFARNHDHYIHGTPKK